MLTSFWEGKELLLSHVIAIDRFYRTPLQLNIAFTQSPAASFPTPATRIDEEKTKGSAGRLVSHSRPSPPRVPCQQC